MIQVRVSISIERPPEEVFRYLSNFENNPKWQSGMIDATFTSRGDLREGSTYDQVATFLGKEIRTTFVVTLYKPYDRIQIKSVKSTFPITVTREVDLTDNGSLVTAIVEGEPGGLFNILKPLLQKMVQRSVTKDYENLKQILEQKS
ncbi:SRPBCC family protein [Pseudalkalibacillus hwajinpoensis]|uniref:SRPBCC family protein n=1 Tax=Guptibacillus hwajinpoensis TaxID=208199 RepID=UPI00325B4C1B